MLKKCYTFLVISCLWLLPGNIQAVSQDVQQRDLIILVDQKNETVSAPMHGAFTSCMLNVLAHEAAPLLVSTSLWQHYIDRKRDFDAQASLPHTAQYTYKNYYSDIMNRLNYWNNIFSKKTDDMAELVQLLETQLTKELFNPNVHKKLRESHLDLPTDTLEFLAKWHSLYCVELPLEKWTMYKVNDYFCLFVPNTLLGLIKTSKTNSLELTTLEKQIGLKVDHLTKIEHPEDGFVYIPTQARPDGIFNQAVSAVLVTKDEYHHQNNNWTIVLGGHGINASYGSDQVHIVADLSLSDFTQFLRFLDTQIATHILLYKTCYGGGKHLYLPYVENGVAKTFSYPIMVLALTDVTATINMGIGAWNPCMAPSFYSGFFMYDTQAKTWKMRNADVPMIQWDRFFTALHDERSLTDIHWLTQSYIVETLAPRSPENLAQVRFAGSDHFIQSFEENVLYITPQLCQLDNTEPLVASYKDLILFSTPYAPIHLIIPENSMMCMSTIPGDAQHYMHILETPQMTFNTIMKGFWQVKGAAYIKEYFFDEIRCVADGVLLDLLDVAHSEQKNQKIQEGDIVTLQNVMLIVEYDHQIRVAFNIDTNFYLGHVRKTHGDVTSLRVLWNMPEYQAQEYKHLYAAKTAVHNQDTLAIVS